MNTRLNPYIGFKDNARQALEFYHDVFGGNMQMDTFKSGGMEVEESEENKLMHGMLTTDGGMVLMMADTPNSMEYHENRSNISISLSGDNKDELQGYWDKLSEGGNIALPLEKAPWGDYFGMCTDKFGINWMVNIAGGTGDSSQ